MKQLLATTALAGLVFGSGCGNSPDESSAGGRVPRAEAFRVAVPDFAPFADAIRTEWDALPQAARGGLQLETVAREYRALRDELFDGGGLAEGRFDVVLLHSDWLAEADGEALLEDLTTRLRKSQIESFPSGWSENFTAMAKIDDRVLGLPYHDGLLCLLYRTDMFEKERLQLVHDAKYGRELTLPETWADLGRLAAFMHRPEYEMYGSALPAEPGGPGPLWILAAQVWPRGGELFGEKGLKLDSPEAEAALTTYRSIVGDRYAMHRDVREMDLFDLGRSFAEGGLVMAVAPVGFAALAQSAAKSPARGHVGVAPLPQETQGGPAAIDACWLLTVPKSCPNADLSYRLVQHCAGEAADKARTLAGVLGTRKSTWDDEEVRRKMPFAAQLDELHESARLMPQRPDFSELAAEADRAVMKAIAPEKETR